MKKLIVSFAFVLVGAFAHAQAAHEYASIEFSPAIRKLGVFSTAAPGKVVDLKTVHMDKRELDIISFFHEVQDMEAQGWEVTSQEIVALDKGIHMYVWTLRKAKP